MSKRGRESEYGRGRPRRLPNPTVYIICEGKKTEVKYFNAIKQACHLTAVTIDSGCKSGCDPKSLLKHAKSMKNEDYDHIWCVFDDDGRNYIKDVLDEARLKPEVSIAFSNPCFELWYLLHYKYSTKPCTQIHMVGRLRKHIKDYEKAMDVFSQLPERTIAVKNAFNLRKHHMESSNDITENPSTNVDELVEFLYSLKNSWQ